uniref:Uncharacterized protein n=1 Tax=Physcomitrium patens TaxID=3218 RepID=A0A2K1KUY5_PHYPA|nr:hypothetical protein PHYPA_004596 [Physcomitrium patens]
MLTKVDRLLHAIGYGAAEERTQLNKVACSWPLETNSAQQTLDYVMLHLLRE